jgi:hypothetical protein
MLHAVLPHLLHVLLLGVAHIPRPTHHALLHPWIHHHLLLLHWLLLHLLLLLLLLHVAHQVMVVLLLLVVLLLVELGCR